MSNIVLRSCTLRALHFSALIREVPLYSCVIVPLQGLLSPLLMILHYHTAYVSLGRSSTSRGEKGGGKGSGGVGGDWGGTEGVGGYIQVAEG